MKKSHGRGTWLAHSVEHATLESRVVSLNPTLSTEITFKKNP